MLKLPAMTALDRDQLWTREISLHKNNECVLQPRPIKYKLVLVFIFNRKEGRDFEKTIVFVPLKWSGQLHHRALVQFLQDHPEGNSFFRTVYRQQMPRN